MKKIQKRASLYKRIFGKNIRFFSLSNLGISRTKAFRYLISVPIFSYAITWLSAPCAANSECTDTEISPKTTITSDRLEMSGSDTENIFKFSGHVKVVGNNLLATSDEMEAYSSHLNDNSSQKENLKGEVGKIEKIIARKNVRIEQRGRIATAGCAELFPQEGKVILSDTPIIEDAQQGKVAGKRITLFQGERRVLIEGDEMSSHRPTIVLPQMPDLGFDEKKAASSKDKESSPSSDNEGKNKQSQK
ncbi:MAG: hypothetical protein A2007_04630 [Verrucomicrobia bacterium GWC2_42_7]|nr:MAG: hypothetical protein A2007_04630 [Verrucomicrobia bacterium GWC2_42_7]